MPVWRQVLHQLSQLQGTNIAVAAATAFHNCEFLALAVSFIGDAWEGVGGAAGSDLAAAPEAAAAAHGFVTWSE